MSTDSICATGRSQANVTGQWQTLPYTMPINPSTSICCIRATFGCSGTGNDPNDPLMQAGLWNPQAGTITVQSLEYDMFCNGMVGLPDGRVLIAGGTLAYNPSFLGYQRLSTYDPATGLFTDEPSMAHGRWYPTTTMLGNGSVMIYSGYTETGPTNNTIEIFSESSGLGTPLTTPWTPPLYPRLHLLPNGTFSIPVVLRPLTFTTLDQYLDHGSRGDQLRWHAHSTVLRYCCL